MKMTAKNKHSSKFKGWSVKMPNEPESKRWQHDETDNNIYIDTNFD